MSRFVMIFGMALLVAGPVVAQQREAVVARQRAGAEVVAARAARADQTLLEGVRVPLEKTVTGAPYSADVVSETTQVLSDGNRIVRRTVGRVVRDGQGRVRREEERDGQVVSITITDPVDKVSYSLDPASRTAWKGPSGTLDVIYRSAAPRSSDPAEIERVRVIERKILEETERRRQGEADATARTSIGGVVRAMPALRPASERRPAWEEKVETLEPRSIEGVMAEGTRTTRTIPAGAIGNERPILIVSEEWRSPDLQVLLLSTTADPRTGESIYKLVNVNRAAPAASVFEVPPDYTVKESGVRVLRERER